MIGRLMNLLVRFCFSSAAKEIKRSGHTDANLLFLISWRYHFQPGAGFAENIMFAAKYIL